MEYLRLLHLTQPPSHKDYKLVLDKVYLPERLYSCRDQEEPATVPIDSQHQCFFTIS